MTDRLSLAGHGPGATPAWRQRAAERRITVAGISAALLTFLTYLTLYRATSMWFGYPTAQSEQGEIDPATMQVILYSTVPLSLAYIAMRAGEFVSRLRQASIAAIVIVFFVFVSVLFSQNMTASIRGFAAFMALTTPLLLYRWRFGLAGFIDFLRTFAIAIAAVNLAYLVLFPQYAIMTGALAGSMRGMFIHKNIFGEFMAICFVVLLPPYPASSLKRKIACWLGLAGCGLCVVLSLSSTSVVLAVVGAMVALGAAVVDRIRGRSKRAVISAIGFLLAVPLFALLNSIVVEIVATSFGKDMTFSGRTEIWAALWPHLFDYPLTGHGFTMMRQHAYIGQMVDSLSWVVASTHNSYLEILLNIGLVGGPAFILFVLMRFFDLFVDSRHTARERVAKGRGAAIIVMVLVGAMTEAGDFLTPGAVWPILAGLLTLDRPAFRRRGRSYAAPAREPELG